MTAQEGSFDDMLIKSINESLEGFFGATTAIAVNFYVDANIAVANPDQYAKSLGKMFGPGAPLLLDRIKKDLSQKTGTPQDSAKSFGDLIGFLRKKYSSRLPPR
jgi:hypothetical protein